MVNRTRSLRSDVHVARGPRKPNLDRAAWERAMRQLRVCSLTLSAVLLALVARMLISGTTSALFVTAAIIAALLIASLRLSHRGRQIEPPTADALSNGQRRHR